MAENIEVDGIREMWSNVLANRWFQPLTHVSARGSPRVWPETCQRRKRETRRKYRFVSLHRGLQYVPLMDPTIRATNPLARTAALSMNESELRYAC
jgi:hypothetical protein